MAKNVAQIWACIPYLAHKFAKYQFCWIKPILFDKYHRITYFKFIAQYLDKCPNNLKIDKIGHVSVRIFAWISVARTLRLLHFSILFGKIFRINVELYFALNCLDNLLILRFWEILIFSRENFLNLKIMFRNFHARAGAWGEPPIAGGFKLTRIRFFLRRIIQQFNIS